MKPRTDIASIMKCRLCGKEIRARIRALETELAATRRSYGEEVNMRHKAEAALAAELDHHAAENQECGT